MIQLKQIKEQLMTDKQMLDAILEAYTNWKETLGAIPNASDRLEMTDDEYDDMMDGYKKEIANLEHDFFILIDKAVERAWTNATFDEDEEIPMEEFLK